jgi:hypothetical protein
MGEGQQGKLTTMLAKCWPTVFRRKLGLNGGFGQNKADLTSISFEFL